MGKHRADERITEHFTWGELCGPKNDVPAAIEANLRVLCLHLERLRSLAGAPVCITSGWRSPAENVACGGVKDSQHLVGKAADLFIPAIPVVEVARMARTIFGGVGEYSAQWFTHCDIGPPGRHWVG